MLLSCTKEIIPELELSLEKVTLSSDGTISTLTVSTNQSSWSFETDKDWITLTKEGNVLTIGAEPNDITTPRTANITIKVGSGSNSLVEMIRVTQQGAVPAELSLSRKALALSQNGSALSVTVTTNQPTWSFAGDENWISVNQDGNEILIGATANISSSLRTGNVTVISGSSGNQVTETIVVTQEGFTTPSLSVSASTFSLTNESATRTLSVTTNQTLWSFSADKNWISLAREGNILTIVAQTNISTVSRTATIIVSAGEGVSKVTQTVLISQQGSTPAAITLTSSNVSLSHTGTGVDLTVTTNQPSWSYTKSEDWIKVTAIGNNLIISADPNSAVLSRRGNVIVTAGPVENRTSVTIVVTQSAAPQATLTLSQNSVSLPQSAATVTVSVTSNQSVFNIMVSDNWVTVVKEGDIITISAPENIYPVPRTSQITVTAGENYNAATRTITVTQQGVIPATLSFTPENVTINQKGDAATVTINTNQPLWSYSSAADWLIVTRAGDVLTFSATANIYPATRIASITVVAGEGVNTKTMVLTVTQEGVIPATVSVSENVVALTHEGVSTTTISVRTNQPSWSFIADKEWIQATLHQGLLIITAAPNPNSEKRTGTVTVNVGSGVNKASATIRVEQDKRPEGTGAGSGSYEELF